MFTSPFWFLSLHLTSRISIHWTYILRLAEVGSNLNMKFCKELGILSECHVLCTDRSRCRKHLCKETGWDSKSTLIIVFWDGGKTQISFMFIPDLPWGNDDPIWGFSYFSKWVGKKPPTRFCWCVETSLLLRIFQPNFRERERERFLPLFHWTFFGSLGRTSSSLKFWSRI